MPKADFLAVLRTLAEQGVDFIVVGGVGAVLQGAPVSTFDLDVVHSREAGNIARLLSALESLDASHLASPGHQLLMTRFGPLDLLGEIGKSRGYGDLAASTTEIDAGAGVKVRVLNLETLIAVKEETAGEKDMAMLPILRRTLQERQR